MRRFRLEEDGTTRERPLPGSNVSGVHAASTSPAPYVEDLERERALIGSIPASDLAVEFEPIANLATFDTAGYEVTPRCLRDGLSEPEELYARATFEKTVGDLGRELRTIAVRECPGAPLFFSVHPGELKDRYLVRFDDPICSHDAAVYLQLSQATLSELARGMVAELSSRSGVGLVLDGLGAGPATLQQLVELEPAAVKIDRELVVGIDRSTRKQAVVSALVNVCAQLGAQLIAKGIERETELQALKNCGVGFGQGKLIGPPSPLPTISIWPPAE